MCDVEREVCFEPPKRRLSLFCAQENVRRVQTTGSRRQSLARALEGVSFPPTSEGIIARWRAVSAPHVDESCRLAPRNVATSAQHDKNKDSTFGV